MAAAGRRPGRRRRTSLICRTALIFRVLAISTPGLLSSPALADCLYICAEQTDPDDGQDEWARGPVIPAGAVLDQAGMVLDIPVQSRRDMRAAKRLLGTPLNRAPRVHGD